MPSTGMLEVQVYQGDSYIPIENALVTVMQGKDEGARIIEKTVKTNAEGRIEAIELETPPIENSMKPSDKRPYGTCDLKVEAKGLKPIIIKGCQIFPTITSVQKCSMRRNIARDDQEIIDILPNTLYGNYPTKIPEDPIKIIPPPSSGFVVLDEPIVPEYIIVHTGSPNNDSAPNYKVNFADYIKNVASSEIYSTWPDSTIRANIYCILSFTLNRIYTEWYKSKGKNYDITNSTAYDHAFVYGRNIYANIGVIVDQIFTSYCKRPAVKQPLLTQYCDGKQVSCPGWLTQWGSKYLGDQGYIPFDILTHFYGTNLSITQAKKVAGSPKSYPGYTLGVGATGDAVKSVQNFLNRISDNYPYIGKLPVTGYYGAMTTEAVKRFQQTFGLPVTGMVDLATWYKISAIYVGVTKIAELSITKERTFIPPVLKDMIFSDVPVTEYYDDIDLD